MSPDPDDKRPRRPDEPAPGEELVPEDDTIIGRAFRWSLAGLVGLAALTALVLWVTRDAPVEARPVQTAPVEAPRKLSQPTAEMPEVAFTDVTASAGIDFQHFNGATGEKLLPETMGGGVAFLDHDGDGDPDLLLVNGAPWPHEGSAARPTPALFRNEGGGRFVDATAGSGLDVTFYGQGVAVADYDADGDVDVFLTAVGRNRLFENRGGRFVDVTDRAGVAGSDDAWSSSAGFFDADGDGDLDLFVCNYVQWSREIDLKLNFTLNGVDRAYGPPTQYQGAHSYLYRNEGDGTFVERGEQAGIRVVNAATGKPMGKALAVTFADVDRDGDLDVFVANDTVQNFVFRNEGDGTFEEVGIVSGIGFDGMGNATGAMGIDAADYANDGTLGVGIGNFANETTSFFVQQQDVWQFVDLANAGGIGSPSRLKLSFGLFFFDYDLDGRLDLLQANGHLEEEINEIQASQHYRQPAQLFWNCGADGRSCFSAVPEERLGDLARPIVGRGAAYADVDADGDLDVLLTESGGSPLLVRNDQQLGRHWLRVRLVGAGQNPEAIGAEVELATSAGVQRRRVMPTRSYLSQVELPVTFGLGETDRVERLTVRWPDGLRSEHPVDGVDRLIVLERPSKAP